MSILPGVPSLNPSRMEQLPHHTFDFLMGRQFTLCTLLPVGTASAATPSLAQLVPKPLFTEWLPLWAHRPMTTEGHQHFPLRCRPPKDGCSPLLLNSDIHSLHAVHIQSYWTQPVLHTRSFQMEMPLPMLPACRNESHSSRAIQMLPSESTFVNPHWTYILGSSLILVHFMIRVTHMSVPHQVTVRGPGPHLSHPASNHSAVYIAAKNVC